MEYHGKLYGKMGNKYFDTGSTSEDFDALQQKVYELSKQVLNWNLDIVTQQRELLIAFSKKTINLHDQPNATHEKVVDNYIKSNL